MTFKNALASISIFLLSAGCETAVNSQQPVSESGSAGPVASKTVTGDARIASFSAPKECERISLDTMRAGGAKRVQSGCVIRSGETMVIVGLSEITTPFEIAFSVTDGDSSGLQQAAAAFPREMLSEYVAKAEKAALEAGEPGWRYTKRRSTLLPGNGGVKGASACVQFSFDGTSTSAPSRKSNVSGLRCARFAKSAQIVQEAMLEVMSFYPANQKAPENYRSIAEQAISSLSFR